MTTQILVGDCRERLRELPGGSVHTVVTSPPYFGLRDYGHAGQIGLEPTPDAYVAEMVAVFREVRRALRDDGTIWINLGDSFGSKQLLGIPWRVAFALQADGWYLRSDIIWAKPNPMPESVTDRPTKAHEYLFLLSKRERYFYDAEAIAEAAESAEHHQRYAEAALGYAKKQPGQRQSGMMVVHANGTRNRRTVWTVASQPFSDAHFATFPPALIEPCIMAGTSEKGCCSKCGAPWRRQVERTAMVLARSERTHDRGQTRSSGTMLEPPRSQTTGWASSCSCDAPVVPCTVLDPFGGAGTTALVADRLGRDAILIELNPVYAAMAEKRLQNDAGMFAAAAVSAPGKDVEEQLGLL